MKKYSRTIFLAAVAMILMMGAPYIKTTCDSGIIFPLAFTGAIFGCSGDKESSVSGEQNQSSIAAASESVVKTDLKVTFVELGSVNCIPCRMMQPVMEKVEKQYPGQVKVVFHDVWTAEGKSAGYKYAVRVIPTQVFLDRDGKEFFRHEGFFSFEEIDKILKLKGVN